ncbi:MAG: hypothetical protein IJ740_08835 [Ruminococcus sp.]|nr:hypothetical protein [Ruminococcus sp.]
MSITRYDTMLKLYDDTDYHVFKSISHGLTFTVTRERYTPFHTAVFSFAADDGFDTSGIMEVSIHYKDEMIFFGRADSLRVTRQSGRVIVSGRASGFTKGLSVCAAEPEILYNCSLTTLFARTPLMPHVTHQAISDTVNYIFIKENDTVWSAIAALSLKLGDEYPFIRGKNSVYIKKENLDSFDYRDDTIVSFFNGENYTNAVSKIYMKGTQDTYDYSYSDAEALARGIIRERYIPLDRQWLSDPEKGLMHKMYFSRRGCVYRGFTYAGHRFENLCDRVRFSFGGSAYWGEADRIVIKGDQSGVFTTITSYHDGYARIMDV